MINKLQLNILSCLRITMRKFKFAFPALLITFLSFNSCEKALIKPAEDNTPENNFDLLWSELNNKYAFFKYKTVNWNEVYDKYRPMIYNDMHDTALFNVMDKMLYELKDGHVNLRSPFNFSRNWNWYLNSPQNFSWEIIERNYLKSDYRITGPFQNKVIDSVGYVYYPSFSNSVTNSQLSFLFDDFKNTKGLIIDIRNNGGGSLSNARTIARRLADEKRLVGSTMVKNGPGVNDFTAPESVFIEPFDNAESFLKPVVILTNRSSYSASSFFTMYVKEFPHITIIGDTTGGGGGLPISGELLNGWIYRFSSTITKDVNEFNIESGIPPHIQQDISQDDILNGIDTILELALDYIINKKKE